MGLFGKLRKARVDEPVDGTAQVVAASRDHADGADAFAGLFGGMQGSSVQVVGDLSSVTEEQRAKLRALGIDLDQVMAQAQQAQQQAMQQWSGLAGGGGDDDTLARLERLAALRAQGVLTDAEFAAQKARILGES